MRLIMRLRASPMRRRNQQLEQLFQQHPRLETLSFDKSVLELPLEGFEHCSPSLRV